MDFPGDAGGKPAETAVGRDHAMARNEQRQRIHPAGASRRTRSPRMVRGLRQVGIGRRSTARNLPQRGPNRAAEYRNGLENRLIQRGAFSRGATLDRRPGKIRCPTQAGGCRTRQPHAKHAQRDGRRENPGQKAVHQAARRCRNGDGTPCCLQHGGLEVGSPAVHVIILNRMKPSVSTMRIMKTARMRWFPCSRRASRTRLRPALPK